MIRIGLLLVLAVGCKDSGSTETAPASAPKKGKLASPEPRGGPPSCGDIAEHMAAGIPVAKDIHAQVQGADVTMSGDSMRTAAAQAISGVCRDNAWPLETRKCAFAWSGNLLRESAKLHAECPGTVAPK